MSKMKKENKGLGMSLLYGLTSFFMSLLLLAAIVCAFETIIPYPDKYTPAFALAVLLLSSFIGAYISAVVRGHSGALTGLLLGIGLVTILLLLTFAFDYGTEWKLFTVYALSVPVTSLFAGVAGVNRASSDKFGKHKKIKLKN